MKRELMAQLGADGVLRLTVPLGCEGAHKTVRVVVETMDATGELPRPFASRDKWLHFIEETAGK